MNGRNSQAGDRDTLLLDMLGKGLTGRFKTPDDERGFSDLLAKLDQVSSNEGRNAQSR